MNNLPAGVTQSMIDSQILPEDVCPNCQDVELSQEFWWRNGHKEEPTGRWFCEMCDYEDFDEEINHSEHVACDELSCVL